MAPTSTATNTTNPPTKKAKTESDDEFVDLVVGGYPFRSTRAVLSPSPYFEALLSGRWKCEHSSKPIHIPDMDGEIFFYILYFLRVGDLPRNINGCVHSSLLPKEDIDVLQEQADFLGLTRLVDLCKKTRDVLKGNRARVGDLDLSDISNFSVKSKIQEKYAPFRVTKVEIEMNYTWKTTKVTAYCKYMRHENYEDYEGYEDYMDYEDYEDYDENHGEHFNIISKGVRSMSLVDTECFDSAFGCLKKLIQAEYEPDEVLSVTSLLDRIPDIPPEARLWYAFVIQDMIRYFSRDKSFSNWNGQDFSGGMEFLFGWTRRDSSTFHSMGSVE